MMTIEKQKQRQKSNDVLPQKPERMKPDIGIADAHLKEIASELNKVLADEHVLYTKLRNYHWNVEGSNFMEMHDFYQSQYEELEAVIDELAERVRMLGYLATGRLKDYVKDTRLHEPESTTDASEQLQNLLTDHEVIIKNLRKFITQLEDKYNDAGTADFVTSLMKMHEKMAWFTRAYLK